MIMNYFTLARVFDKYATSRKIPPPASFNMIIGNLYIMNESIGASAVLSAVYFYSPGSAVAECISDYFYITASVSDVDPVKTEIRKTTILNGYSGRSFEIDNPFRV